MEERLVDEGDLELIPVVPDMSEAEVERLKAIWMEGLPEGYRFCPWQSFLDFEDWLYRRLAKA